MVNNISYLPSLGKSDHLILTYIFYSYRVTDLNDEIQPVRLNFF